MYVYNESEDDELRIYLRRLLDQVIGWQVDQLDLEALWKLTEKPPKVYVACPNSSRRIWLPVASPLDYRCYKENEKVEMVEIRKIEVEAEYTPYPHTVIKRVPGGRVAVQFGL